MLAILGLAACATPSMSEASHIEGVANTDLSRLTVTIADILAGSLAPTTTTLRILPVDGRDQNPTETLLESTLRERGFALAPGGMPYPGAHTIRFAISPISQNVMLELDADDASTTCLYAHDAAHGLVAVGSCTSHPGASLALNIPPSAAPAGVQVAVAEHPAIVGVSNLSGGAPSSAPARIPASPGRANGTARHDYRGSKVTVHATRQTQPGTGQPVDVVEATATPQEISPASEPLPPSWTLAEGQPIKDQVIAWGVRAGWRVKWPDTLDWVVPASATFDGAFGDNKSGPIVKVVRALASEGRRIKVVFHPGNGTSTPMLVVSNPSGSDLK